jgi:hypothetical protein
VAFNQTQWIGNYVATGVTSVEMDLKNFTTSPESIRIALRASAGGSTTPGYSSTTPFSLAADGAWHHAVFSLDSGSLTAINSPAPLSTFLTSVGDFRVLQAAAAPSLIGDAGNFQVGVDNITAVGQQELSFQPPTVSMPESDAGPTPFVFTVVLSHDSGATVTYATADGTATTADSDYVAASGTLTFAPGVTSQEITVTVNGDPAVEPDENFVVNLSSPTNSTIATSQATGTIVNDDSIVADRFLFYQNSPRYDQPGGTFPQNTLTFSDDNAIATDKRAYLPGSGAATFADVSSYVQGINGIMVDLLGAGAHSSITASDFIFKTGNTTTVDGTWTTLSGAALPTGSVRLGMTGAANGAGTTSGTDRVEMIWAPGTAVTQKWLEVTVTADANTGLIANDVFFFGNEIGDMGASNTSTVFKVSAIDTTSTQTHGSPVGNNNPITNLFDFNRDGAVGAADITLDQTHGTTNSTGLVVINIASGGPFAPLPSAAPATSSSQTAVASALVSSSQSPAPSATPPWLANRLALVDLNQGPVAKYFEHLADDNTAKSRAILVRADHVAGALGLDDELLDSLLVGLGLE